MKVYVYKESHSDNCYWCVAEYESRFVRPDMIARQVARRYKDGVKYVEFDSAYPGTKEAYAVLTTAID